MAEIAKTAKVPLAVRAEDLDALAELTRQLVKAGVEDLVLDPAVTRTIATPCTLLTHMRRLALKKLFRPLGYPVMTFPGVGGRPTKSSWRPSTSPSTPAWSCSNPSTRRTLYPLLVLRQNIYTDPQKPIQVQPGVYEINAPDAKAPVLGHDQLLHHVLLGRQ